MTPRRLSRLLLMPLALLALAGCGRHATETKPASRLTEAQRDTALARSSLPGASTVGRALDVSGQGAGHAAQVDSLTR
jgi:hypothetical protein